MKKIKLEIKKSKGFVLLFAVTLAAIFLSIALGVADITLKEINFSTSVKNSNNAFFAADTGAECALYWDSSTSTNNIFGGGGDASSMTCADQMISLQQDSSSSWSFDVNNLGIAGYACAKVTVTKTFSSDTPPVALSTSIVSKGYNIGSGGAGGTCSPTSNAVERELDTNY